MADLTDFTHGDDWDVEYGKSKTQVKKEMTALQKTQIKRSFLMRRFQSRVRLQALHPKTRWFYPRFGFASFQHR